MYDHWMDIMEPVIFGKRIRITVNRARFNSNVKMIRDQLDPDAVDKPLTNAMIREGFKAFATAVSSGQLGIDGKNAWSVFMGRWQKLVPGAPPPREGGFGGKTGAWWE